MAQVATSVVLALTALVAPLAAQTSLSIYSDGRVVVRRSLAQPLDKGRNTVTLKLDALDPATLFSPDTSVALVSAVLRPATDQGTALARAVGQTLAFVRPRERAGPEHLGHAAAAEQALELIVPQLAEVGHGHLGPRLSFFADHVL